MSLYPRDQGVTDLVYIYREEAELSSKFKIWKDAIIEEMSSLQKITWELSTLLKGKKTISCKWVFAKKQGSLDGDTIRYEARLVSKGYAKKEGIDYNEVLLPVMKQLSIQILLALAAKYELEFDLLDVKIAFFHGDLEEEIYMSQPMGSKLLEMRI